MPTIVQLELFKWLARKVDEDKADQVIAFTETCRIIVFDTQVALAAADVSARHKLAIADAIVYATARSEGAKIVTCDTHSRGWTESR